MTCWTPALGDIVAASGVSTGTANGFCPNIDIGSRVVCARPIPVGAMTRTALHCTAFAFTAQRYVVNVQPRGGMEHKTINIVDNSLSFLI